MEEKKDENIYFEYDESTSNLHLTYDNKTGLYYPIRDTVENTKHAKRLRKERNRELKTFIKTFNQIKENFNENPSEKKLAELLSKFVTQIDMQGNPYLMSGVFSTIERIFPQALKFKDIRFEGFTIHNYWNSNITEKELDFIDELTFFLTKVQDIIKENNVFHQEEIKW